MSLYTRLKASLVESICYVKHLEEEDVDKMVDFQYELSDSEIEVQELENELGEKDAEIAELKQHISNLEAQKYDNDLE